MVEQAKGIIMAGRRCSADDAFEVLEGVARRAGLSLREIAQNLVDTVSTG